MKRFAIVTSWYLVGLALACFGGVLVTRVLLAHFVFDVPWWLENAIKNAIQWIDPDYSPDALDVEVVCTWLMFLASTLFIATVIAIASVIAWRRYRKASFPP
jgi:hypothetical protein